MSDRKKFIKSMTSKQKRDSMLRLAKKKKKDLVEKYLNESNKYPWLQGWEMADERTKDIFYNEGDAVYMRRYHGYDLTIINKNGKWIPIHGVKKMKPEKTAKKASMVLTMYVDKLPDSKKIIGDMGR